MVTREQIIEVLKTIEDPEILLDIWFLGLIYRLDIIEDKVEIDMTFTTPLCPVGPELTESVRSKVAACEGVKEVDLKVIFVPPWKPNEEVRALLGLE
jgi:metal-sulfur cluster biosynthetic enzyme